MNPEDLLGLGSIIQIISPFIGYAVPRKIHGRIVKIISALMCLGIVRGIVLSTYYSMTHDEYVRNLLLMALSLQLICIFFFVKLLRQRSIAYGVCLMLVNLLIAIYLGVVAGSMKILDEVDVVRNTSTISGVVFVLASAWILRNWDNPSESAIEEKTDSSQL